MAKCIALTASVAVCLARPASIQFERSDPSLNLETGDYFTHNTDVASYEREVCISYTSALCSPRRLSLETARVHRGFITKDTSVCRLICSAIGAPIQLWIKKKYGHYNGPGPGPL